MATISQEINQALKKCLKEDERTLLIGEDICDPYGGAFKVTKGLSSEFPSQVINTPISEAGITGIAIGLAIQGFKPILEIMFGDFLTLAMDQISSNISKLPWLSRGEISIPLVIRTPMGGRRSYGATHSQCIEKILFGIPGISIIAPSAFHDHGQLLTSCINSHKPQVFLEYKLDYGKQSFKSTRDKYSYWKFQENNDEFSSLKASATEFEDEDILIVSYGGMATFSIEAATKALIEDEIACQIFLPSKISPFHATEELFTAVNKIGKVLIVEEGTIDSGWGAEVATIISENCFASLKAPILRVGAANTPIPNSSILENEILPSNKDILDKIRDLHDY